MSQHCQDYNTVLCTWQLGKHRLYFIFIYLYSYLLCILLFVYHIAASFLAGFCHCVGGHFVLPLCDGGHLVFHCAGSGSHFVLPFGLRLCMLLRVYSIYLQPFMSVYCVILSRHILVVCLGNVYVQHQTSFSLIVFIVWTSLSYYIGRNIKSNSLYWYSYKHP